MLNFKSQSRFNWHQISKKGFTLVELLVVIAILGVLAAVVIVALNPAEQLARGRDAGRLSSVTQLGSAMQSYATNQGTGTYPGSGQNNLTWQTTYLKANAEINTIVNAPAASAECNINIEGNICYNTSGTDAVVWTIDESQSVKTKAGCGVAGGPNANNPIAAAAWIASQGKAGITCQNTVQTIPAYNATLN